MRAPTKKHDEPHPPDRVIVVEIEAGREAVRAGIGVLEIRVIADDPNYEDRKAGPGDEGAILVQASPDRARPLPHVEVRHADRSPRLRVPPLVRAEPRVHDAILDRTAEWRRRVEDRRQEAEQGPRLRRICGGGRSHHDARFNPLSTGQPRRSRWSRQTKSLRTGRSVRPADT